MDKALNRLILIRILIISILLSFLLFFYISFSELGNIPPVKLHIPKILYLVTVVYITGWTWLYFSQRIGNLLPWKKSINTRFFSGIMINLLVGIVCLVLFGFLYLELFHPDYQPVDFLTNYKDSTIKFLVVFFLVTIVFSVLDFAFKSYKIYSNSQLESTRIVREQLDLQFEALKKQMSPHFLFNSLNTVSSLIYRSTDLAEDFVRELTKTYKAVLKNHNRQAIPLVNELEMVRSYSYLISVRYENTISINITIPDSYFSMLVPPLSVQMLIENAIKHNHFNHDNPLRIDVFVENEDLVVRNNFIGQPKYINVKNKLIENPVSDNSFKVGLENIKHRYKFLTNSQVRIKKDDHFTVWIPLIKPAND